MRKRCRARAELHDGRYWQHAGGLDHTDCDLGGLYRKQHPYQAAEQNQPPENGHDHRPAPGPNIVTAHDRKSGDKHGDAGNVDQHRIARELRRKTAPAAKVQQHTGAVGDEGGTQQSGDQFREVVIAAPFQL